MADRAYAAGLELAPDNGQLRNNKGWSLLLRSRWHEAHREFATALRQMPEHPMIRANLDLAAAAIAGDLPVRRAGESSRDYAARLNDAGLIKLQRGEQKLAIAAFARAIEASERWFARAANNLELAAGYDALSAPEPPSGSAPAR
jgi:Tfp pilus assembly protein PilF